MAVVRLPGPRRRSKYGNKRTLACLECGSELVRDGACVLCRSRDTHRFDSKAEWHRYNELLVLKRSKIIRDLRVQPRYDIEINGKHVGHYVADFDYWLDGELVVEDVKGGTATDTPLSKFKRKCVEAGHGITVTTVRR